jgi:phosphoribosylglycinamide formyltransferase 1
VRVAVLASGTGSLLAAILEAGLPVDLVVVDRPCPALDVAARHRTEAVLVERPSFGPDFDRFAYTKAVVASLEEHAIDLVVMAGFGTVFAEPIFEAYEGHIINTHPALLPAFKGWHAVDAALEAGVKVTGCTVHVATLEVDSGPILAQEAVPVLADDTVESLHERIKDVERRLYPATIAEIIQRGSVLP